MRVRSQWKGWTEQAADHSTKHWGLSAISEPPLTGFVARRACMVRRKFEELNNLQYGSQRWASAFNSRVRVFDETIRVDFLFVLVITKTPPLNLIPHREELQLFPTWNPILQMAESCERMQSTTSCRNGTTPTSPISWPVFRQRYSFYSMTFIKRSNSMDISLLWESQAVARDTCAKMSSRQGWSHPPPNRKVRKHEQNMGKVVKSNRLSHRTIATRWISCSSTNIFLSSLTLSFSPIINCRGGSLFQELFSSEIEKPQSSCFGDWDWIRSFWGDGEGHFLLYEAPCLWQSGDQGIDCFERSSISNTAFHPR